MDDIKKKLFLIKLRIIKNVIILLLSIKKKYLSMWRSFTLKVLSPLVHTLSDAYFNFRRADFELFFKKTRLYGICLLVVVFIVLFPCAYTFFNETKPYFGDFTWTPVNPVRISRGAFSEDGRGGLEHYVPKLRLIEYQIKQGDTLWSISRKFEVDPDSIISSNMFSNVHSIHEGDIILIPNIRGIFVSVEEGDTIFKYSSKYKIQPDFIMEVNDLYTHSLTPGMKIFLPDVRFTNIERAYALGEAFEKPCRGRLTSRFGYRRDPFTGKRAFHTGVDIANRVGEKVRAAQEGRVIFAGVRSRYGYTVILAHNFGYKTLYGHLSNVVVERGQQVKRGQVIGYIGNTGRSTGPHLHFEVWLNHRLIDPLTQTNMSIR
jgi:murein DD-endopeptidase MepM/ murein hydrolase activator NlpD